MGRGPVQLLQGIERLGSINQAAKEMNLSYVKALKMIKNIEASVGGKILITKIGGKEHGGAELTPVASKFLMAYTAYEAEVTTFAQEKSAFIKDWRSENENKILTICRNNVWFLALLLLFLTANVAAAPEKTLMVSAAISLKDVLTRLAPDFEKKNAPLKIQFNFAASGPLRAQIEGGAPVDVFISAAVGDVDKLSLQKMIVESSRINLVANHLVLIVNKKHPPALSDIGDLTQNTIQRIAIGNPATPAGQYAKDALSYYKLYDKLTTKLILGENVRQVLDYVARGEVDCGFVYTTDARIEKAVAIVQELPENTHKPIIYPAVVISSSQNAPLAGQFIKFLQEPGSATVFKKYGFEQRK